MDYDHQLPDGLIARLFAVMRAHNGAGLAAPQIGESLRVFVMGEESFVNPAITERSAETVVYEEGCLSLPGVVVDVRRNVTITLQTAGRIVRLTGQQARIAQHEVDHLDGKLITDYAGARGVQYAPREPPGIVLPPDTQEIVLRDIVSEGDSAPPREPPPNWTLGTLSAAMTRAIAHEVPPGAVQGDATNLIALACANVALRGGSRDALANENLRLIAELKVARGRPEGPSAPPPTDDVMLKELGELDDMRHAAVYALAQIRELLVKHWGEMLPSPMSFRDTDVGRAWWLAKQGLAAQGSDADARATREALSIQEHVAASRTPERPPDETDLLAQDIRAIDGNHTLGAGALADALIQHGWTHRGDFGSRTPDPQESPQ